MHSLWLLQVGIPDIFEGILGQYGALVALMVACVALWRLFREERADRRKDRETIVELSTAVKELTSEVKAWRQIISRVSMEHE